MPTIVLGFAAALALGACKPAPNSSVKPKQRGEGLTGEVMTGPGYSFIAPEGFAVEDDKSARPPSALNHLKRTGRSPGQFPGFISVMPLPPSSAFRPYKMEMCTQMANGGRRRPDRVEVVSFGGYRACEYVINLATDSGLPYELRQIILPAKDHYAQVLCAAEPEDAIAHRGCEHVALSWATEG
jgi:hypothetical protein